MINYVIPGECVFHAYKSLCQGQVNICRFYYDLTTTLYNPPPPTLKWNHSRRRDSCQRATTPSRASFVKFLMTQSIRREIFHPHARVKINAHIHQSGGRAQASEGNCKQYFVYFSLLKKLQFGGSSTFFWLKKKFMTFFQQM